MKFKLYVFLIFLFVTQSSAQVKFANVIGPQTYKYGTIGNVVCKFDPTGQSVWAKSLSGSIVASTDTNYVIGSAFDGNDLYVCVIQGYFNSMPGHTVNGSVIKMDTLGNVLFVKSSSVMPSGVYSIYDIYPAFGYGAWVFDKYASGITHQVHTQRFDSSGTPDTLIDYWYGSISSPGKMLFQVDSTYIVCVNHYPSAGGANAFPTLTKLDSNGGIIWRMDYGTNLNTGFERLQEVDVTNDSAGNLYMVCNYISGLVGGTVTIKFDSLGQPVDSRFWTSIQTTYQNRVQYSNGQITLSMDSTKIIFDTLWNNACLSSQPVIISTNNHYNPQPHPQTYSAQTFSPAAASSVQYIPVVLPDYCFVDVSVGNLNSKKSTINIESKDGMILIESVSDQNDIVISDLQGRIVLQKSFNKRFEFDTRVLTGGIYFIVVRNSFEKTVRKILVE